MAGVLFPAAAVISAGADLNANLGRRRRFQLFFWIFLWGILHEMIHSDNGFDLLLVRGKVCDEADVAFWSSDNVVILKLTAEGTNFCQLLTFNLI